MEIFKYPTTVFKNFSTLVLCEQNKIYERHTKLLNLLNE